MSETEGPLLHRKHILEMDLDVQRDQLRVLGYELEKVEGIEGLRLERRLLAKRAKIAKVEEEHRAILEDLDGLRLERFNLIWMLGYDPSEPPEDDPEETAQDDSIPATDASFSVVVQVVEELSVLTPNTAVFEPLTYPLAINAVSFPTVSNSSPGLSTTELLSSWLSDSPKLQGPLASPPGVGSATLPGPAGLLLGW